MIIIFNALKNLLTEKYNIKNLDKRKIIIEWQIIRNIAVCIMKIDQSAFIKNLVIQKRLIKCNTNVIAIKASSDIEMFKLDNYKETNLQIYQ